MTHLEKLLRKLPKKDSLLLQRLVEQLLSDNHQGLHIIKLQGSELFRLKKRHFRIMFHREQGEIVIDSIRIRNESTYKRLP